jgi:cell division initiation protein
MSDKIEISPADIRHKEFSGSMFGYKKSEIRDYLDMLADLFEDLYAQRLLNNNEAQVNVYEDRAQTQLALEQIQKREELIAKTLIQAENTRNEIIRTARIEAENIIKEAELSAKKAIDDTKVYISTLKHEFITLKEHRRQFISNAHAQLRIVIERLEQDPLFHKEKSIEVDRAFDEASRIKITKKAEDADV